MYRKLRSIPLLMRSKLSLRVTGTAPSPRTSLYVMFDGAKGHLRFGFLNFGVFRAA